MFCCGPPASRSDCRSEAERPRPSIGRRGNPPIRKLRAIPAPFAWCEAPCQGCRRLGPIGRGPMGDKVMGFEPAPDNGRRVVDPDTGFWLEMIPRDVPPAQRLFDFCVGKAPFALLFEYRAGEEDKTFYFSIDGKRLRNSYVTTQNLYGEAPAGSWERFQAMIKDAVKAYVLRIVPRSLGWKTEVMFEWETTMKSSAV